MLYTYVYDIYFMLEYKNIYLLDTILPVHFVVIENIACYDAACFPDGTGFNNKGNILSVRMFGL